MRSRLNAGSAGHRVGFDERRSQGVIDFKDGEHYRVRAHEYREKASTAPDDLSRTALRALAREYERIAAQAEVADREVANRAPLSGLRWWIASAINAAPARS
jgi:hypothetical protein